MKSFILIAVLAALTVCNNAASISDEGASVYQERSIGRLEDVIVFSRMVYLDSWPHAVKVQDIEFNGNASTTITGVRVFNPPNGNFTTTALGLNFVTITLTTPPGGTVSSLVQIFARVY